MRLVPADTAPNSLTFGRGACDVCPGSPELKATGPSWTDSNSPISRLSEFFQRGRTAENSSHGAVKWEILLQLGILYQRGAEVQAARLTSYKHIRSISMSDSRFGFAESNRMSPRVTLVKESV